MNRLNRQSFSPRYVLFDAVGTLLRPEPSVGDAYHAAGAAAGSRLTRDEVTRRFRAEFARRFADKASEGRTSDAVERERWRQVVADVFDDVSDVDDRLFPELWRHFGDSRNWRLYDDAAVAWRALREAGHRLGMASNFDSRLTDVCRGLPAVADCRFLFASSEIGWAKPSPEFYRTVERRLDCRSDELLLVGDDFRNDYVGAKAAGWCAIWLRRDPATPPPADPDVDWLDSLDELPSRLSSPANSEL